MSFVQTACKKSATAHSLVPLGASGGRHSGGKRLKANSGNDYREAVTRKLAGRIPLKSPKIFTYLSGEADSHKWRRILKSFFYMKRFVTGILAVCFLVCCSSMSAQGVGLLSPKIPGTPIMYVTDSNVLDAKGNVIFNLSGTTLKSLNDQPIMYVDGQTIKDEKGKTYTLI